jgi:membrane-associated phospholipid phosphatase
VARVRRWWPDVALLAGFVGLTLALRAGWLLGVDVAVVHWTDTHRPALLAGAARVVNLLGAGYLLVPAAFLVAGLVAGRARTWYPLLRTGVVFALSYPILWLLKDLTARPAPHAPLPHPERLGLGGDSYPSGHLVNAIIWYSVLAVLLAGWLTPVQRRLLMVGPPALLTVTTVYLGYHWLTDTLAGILLGVPLARQLGRIPPSRAGA